MEAAYNFSRRRRVSSRKEYQTEVSFSVGAMCFSGMLENVSTGGALLLTQSVHFIKPGREIIITIPFAEKQGAIKKNAIVIRAEGKRIGVQFV